jgi:spore coat protein U-like protein
MKKLLTVAAAAGLAVVLASGAFAASNSGTIDVSASVLDVCKFSTTSGVVDFGALDPSSGAAVNVNAGTELQYWCTNKYSGYAFTIAGANDSGGNHQLKYNDGTTDYFIPYTLTYDATAEGKGMGAANVLTPSTTATIAANTYDDAPAGAYADTITVTFSY